MEQVLSIVRLPDLEHTKKMEIRSILSGLVAKVTEVSVGVLDTLRFKITGNCW
jgi:hypothetical protein